MSPEQLSFIIGFIYGSALTLLLFCSSRRSRNRRDPFLDCRDHSGSQFNEGRTIRGNGNGGPTTPKPELPPGYRSINYPNPSPDRLQTNPFNG